MEPRSVDALARLAALGASRRQLLRFALGSMGGLALARHGAAAQDTCNDPFIYCDGMCVYSLTSNEHCGTCGNACGDLVCIEGVCTACEDVGLTTCEALSGGSLGLHCADLANSVNDCGTCGNGCTTGPCVDGICTSTVDCEPGFTECWGECVDLQTDTFHCGTCFTECAGEVGAGESSVGICVAGECQSVCLDGYTLCDGQCVAGTCDDSGGTNGTGAVTPATTLPATGSGPSGGSGDSDLTSIPVVGGVAVLAAAGWRLLARRETGPGSEPPA